MFAFITLGTNNLSLSSKFYDKLLESLGIFKVINQERYIGYAKKAIIVPLPMLAGSLL